MKKVALGLTAAALLMVLPQGSSDAASSSTPKCSGYALTSYKKDLKIASAQWAEYQKWTAIGKTTDDPAVHQLIRLDYQNWLYDGYALAKWAKACKVSMPQPWLDMLNSLPN